MSFSIFSSEIKLKLQPDFGSFKFLQYPREFSSFFFQPDAKSGGDDDIDDEDECDSDFDAKSGCELKSAFLLCLLHA